MDFRLISRIHGLPDPLKDVSADQAASDHTITVYKGTDEIAICVSQEARSAGRRASAAGVKDVYVSVSPEPQAAAPQVGQVRISVGENQQKLALTAENLQAMGLDTSHFMAVANQLSASKVSIRTSGGMPMGAAPGNTEALLVAELGQFAMQLMKRVGPPSPQEVRW